MDRVENQAGKVARAQGQFQRMEELHRQMIAASPKLEEAHRVSESLLAIEEDLLNRGYDAETAHLALNELIDLRDRVEAQAGTVAKAQDELDQLVDLKDSVLQQQGDVADAVETLELTVELRQQMHRASDTFDDIRRMMTEIVILEPTVERAVRGLRPITELGNLRHMSVGELRQAAQTIFNGRNSTLADDAELDSPSEIVADANLDGSSTN